MPAGPRRTTPHGFGSVRLLIADPTGFDGGVGTLTLSLANELAELGHEPILASPSRDRANAYSVLEERVQWKAWPPQGASERRALGRARLRAQRAGQILRARRFLRWMDREETSRHNEWLSRFGEELRVDACLFPCVLGWDPGGLNLPMSCVMHDLNWNLYPENFPNCPASEMNRLTERWLRAAKHVFCVSNFATQELAVRFPRFDGKLITVPNGFNSDLPSRSAPDGGLPRSLGGKRFLLYPGWVGLHKGHSLLLGAFAEAAAADQDLHLVLTGNGSDRIGRRELDDLPGVRALDGAWRALSDSVKRRIVRAGAVESGTLAWLYRNCVATVLPSEYEGFGLPLLEALAANSPVIVSDIGAFQEIADRYDVRASLTWFRTGSPAELAREILQAASERREPAIPAGALDSWTWASAAEAYVRALDPAGQ